jgi:RNA polymerase sigma-70 factor (ECF subfamily)
MTGFPDDKDLIEQFKDPSLRERAFTTVIKKYQEKTYWHIRRIVIQHDDANDVMQNVFLKVWNNLEKFREGSTLFTWIYRIATNECLSFLEEQKKKRNSTSLHDPDSNLSNRVRAEEHFDGKKLEWKLQIAIQQLPEKQRVIFNMRYFDGMTYDQISEVLGTSSGGLKANYHHAVKKIEEFILSD